MMDRCVGNLESRLDASVYPHMILGTLNETEALRANIRFMGMAEVVDSLSKMDGISQKSH
ncbi:hypothetical protein [Campylobacter sp.]|uniref:hypothetical protein n=1 Tax=Campylobacter sp. TaxID=205 RepID=UPI0026DBD3B2|nr:hypothetical protein [Campylobacter sp.]MDO4673915.1 hypothetical protein [Campylobacter sp.]